MRLCRSGALLALSLSLATPAFAAKPHRAAARESLPNLAARCAEGARSGKALDVALAARDRAVRLDIGPEVLQSRGLVLMRRGDGRAALADFTAALRTKPNMAAALFARGLLELDLDHTDEGWRDISRARALDPSVEAALRDEGFSTPYRGPAAAPEGWDGVRLGMSLAEIREASSVPFNAPTASDGPAFIHSTSPVLLNGKPYTESILFDGEDRVVSILLSRDLGPAVMTADQCRATFESMVAYLERPYGPLSFAHVRPGGLQEETIETRRVPGAKSWYAMRRPAPTEMIKSKGLTILRGFAARTQTANALLDVEEDHNPKDRFCLKLNITFMRRLPALPPAPR